MTMSSLPPNTGASEFGSALLDPEAGTPDGLIGPDGLHAPKRFNVYRNNVIVSLCEALGETFPAIKSLLGDDYFNALARAFVASHPPQSPVLMWYGADFPDFIDAFPPLENYPYLADVARLEWHWLQAYHAADKTPMDPGVLGGIAPEEVGAVRFEVHPATALVISRWPVLDLVRVNRFEPEANLEISLQEPQSVLMTRPELDVDLYLLRPGGDVFLKALSSGETLGEAAARAQAEFAEFSLSDCLSDCLSSGAFTGVEIDR